MHKKQQAFTLLEIMLVVAIIGLLMSAAIYKIVGNLDIARHTKVQSDIQAFTTQLRLYESLNGFYPTTEQGLQALVTQPTTEPKPARWTQLMTDLQNDPWQSPYIYLCPGKKNPGGFDLYSSGKDRVPDTTDDDWGQ